MSDPSSSPLHADRVGNAGFVLPTIGELVKLAVDLFDLGALPGAKEWQPSKSSTTKRFFQGKSVSSEEAAGILRAFSTALVEAGIIPAPRQGDAAREEFVDIIHEALSAHARQWGHFVALVRTVAPHDDPDALVRGVVRQVVIDLALRSMAWAMLTDPTSIPVDTLEAPWWIAQDARARVLHSLVEEAKARQAWVSREKFAEALDVEDTMLDRWLSGEHRPREDNLRGLAEGFARLIGGSKEELLVRLRRSYAQSELSCVFRERFGERFLLECALSWSWIRWRASREFAPEEVLKTVLAQRSSHPLIDPSDVLSTKRIEQAARDSLVVILCGGVHCPHGGTLAEDISASCGNLVWRMELCHAKGGWLARVQEAAQEDLVPARLVVPKVARELGISEEEALRLHKLAASLEVRVANAEGGRDLRAAAKNAFVVDLRKLDSIDRAEVRRAAEDGRAIRVVGDNRHSSRNQMIQFQAARRAGRIDEALVHGQRAIDLAPDDANHQFFFGAFLGQIGRVEQALEHLWISAALEPMWDRPRVEIAVVFSNAGRDDEALAHAEKEIPALARPTDFAWYILGRLRRIYGKPREARDALERSLAINPHDLQALVESLWACEDLGDRNGIAHFKKRIRETGADPDAFKDGFPSGM